MSITPIARCPGNPKAWLRCAASIGVQAGCGGCTLNCPPISQAACGGPCGPAGTPIPNTILCPEQDSAYRFYRVSGLLPATDVSTNAWGARGELGASDALVLFNAAHGSGNCPGNWPFDGWVYGRDYPLRFQSIPLNTYGHGGLLLQSPECVDPLALSTDPASVINSVFTFNNNAFRTFTSNYLHVTPLAGFGVMTPCDASLVGAPRTPWGLGEKRPLIRLPDSATSVTVCLGLIGGTSHTTLKPTVRVSAIQPELGGYTFTPDQTFTTVTPLCTTPTPQLNTGFLTFGLTPGVNRFLMLECTNNALVGPPPLVAGKAVQVRIVALSYT